MVVDGLVYQYFFQIGAGIASGAFAVGIPSLLIYRVISNRLNRKGASDL